MQFHDVACGTLPLHTLWRKMPVLKVFFMEEPTQWTYQNSTLQSWMVMDIVKEGWNMEGIKNGEHVPCFEQTSKPYDAQIRVKFSKYNKRCAL